MSAAVKLAAASTHDIIETAQNNGSFTRFVAAAKAAGLVDTLKGAGPFTVFAPSDEAFKKLPTGAFDNLLKPGNKAELTQILKYHVIAGSVSSSELQGKKFKRKSVEGSELSLDGTAGVMVNRAHVTGPDIEASNGVIHLIDTVLMPPKA